MARLDNTLRMLGFQGVGLKDPNKHMFVCETVWAAKNVEDEAKIIAQLETMFRDHALVWYMKLLSTTPAGQVRTLKKLDQHC
jgi:hypothetical protein